MPQRAFFPVLARVLLPLMSLATSCASSAEPAPGDPTAEAAEAAETGASAGGESAPTPAQLEGSWVEFWALSGRADTQRFTFLPDGRFGWTAAPGSSGSSGSSGSPARRFGRYSVHGAELILQVQGEDARGDCTDAAPCRTFHDPAVELRLALGACPDNPEASSLDESYRCAAIAGQAFWQHDGLRADGLAELAK